MTSLCRRIGCWHETAARSSSHRCPTFCYGFWVKQHVSWKRCVMGFEIRILLFSWWVCQNASPISSYMYINHAVLKRQRTQWVEVKSFTNVSAAARYTQQFKILEDMFVLRVFFKHVVCTCLLTLKAK